MGLGFRVRVCRVQACRILWEMLKFGGPEDPKGHVGIIA